MVCHGIAVPLRHSKTSSALPTVVACRPRSFYLLVSIIIWSLPLLTLLFRGGWGGCEYYSAAMSSSANRTTFINALASAVSTYNLDGECFEILRWTNLIVYRYWYRLVCPRSAGSFVYLSYPQILLLGNTPTLRVQANLTPQMTLPIFFSSLRPYAQNLVLRNSSPRLLRSCHGSTQMGTLSLMYPHMQSRWTTLTSCAYV